MKSLAALLSLAGSLASVSALAVDTGLIPAGALITPSRFEVLKQRAPKLQKCSKTDDWGNAVEGDRTKITIRASEDDNDDISEDFLWAIKEANNGGLLHLEKGKKYVIGKKLDLSFLNDVYVKIDGELKVRLNTLAPRHDEWDTNKFQFTNDIEYWQSNNFYYDFQKSITFWVWGGK